KQCAIWRQRFLFRYPNVRRSVGPRCHVRDEPKFRACSDEPTGVLTFDLERQCISRRAPTGPASFIFHAASFVQSFHFLIAESRARGRDAPLLPRRAMTSLSEVDRKCCALRHMASSVNGRHSPSKKPPGTERNLAQDALTKP